MIYKILFTIIIIGLDIALVSLFLKPTNTPVLTDIGMSIMIIAVGIMGIVVVWKEFKSKK